MVIDFEIQCKEDFCQDSEDLLLGVLFCVKVSLALLHFMTMTRLVHLRYQRVEIELQVVHTEVLSKATLNSLSELPQILSKVRCLLIHS